MTALLSDAVAELSHWALSAPKSKNGQIAISNITGKNSSVQLLTRDRIGEIYTPFDPSVFRGTGSEPRKGIVFAIPVDVFEDLQKIEAWAQKQVPGAVWHTALKEAGAYSCSVKAKINVSGPHACTLVNEDGKPVAWPESWARRRVLPVFEIRGVYSQKTGSGLIIDVTHMMLGESGPSSHYDFL